MGNLDVFWNADIEELKQGYMEEENHYLCLLCSKKIEKGIIYQDSGILYEAEKYMKIHIEQSHDSVFDYLIQLDKKLTGLTEHQNHLLRLFYQGKSDTDIQKETGIGSASTIRNHRFVLKEKERQAKLFLVMMELLKEKDQHAPSFLPLHKTAKMVDERYNITEDEMEKTLKKYFPEGIDGPLKKFPLKEKQKLVVLREIVKRFSPNKKYTEKEINEVLTAIYPDYVVLRRYLIEYGFIDRKSDGSSYWLKA
ncbi:DUF2087 domain-containing protein [Bacillus sp. AFS053548]|uniref:DUF2087 domain-containing protein n=1 Tax=Bacillus sp. AFS053548 TaxID=2033505 RepID=UPI000BFDE39A|nr:DUF2087 domain-containing protein [Bacillus sp. AFS053548]PGM52251.1 transcriptional regulator [Bacillus sp. AFS053548]